MLTAYVALRYQNYNFECQTRVIFSTKDTLETYQSRNEKIQIKYEDKDN